MEIPRHLANEIRDGRVVLVLGAGASLGATSADGRMAPKGTELALEIAKKYLSDGHQDSSLAVVAELAQSESSVAIVQQFIADRFKDLLPTDFQQLLPTFKWAGIATTNFDFIVERAYQSNRKRAQDLVPFTTNDDCVEDKLKSARSVSYIKLHGCISCADDSEVPFILTPDQYVTHKKGRNLLFKRLKDWGYNHSIVFVGHRLQDPDIRQLLQELGISEDNRPMYYVVATGMSLEEQRFWGAKRITPLPGTYKDFLTALDASLDPALRQVSLVTPASEHPITHMLIDPQSAISDVTSEFLDTGAAFLHKNLEMGSIDPFKFYRGYVDEWAPIAQSLDVRRNIEDSILSDVVLSHDAENAARARLCLILGPAGSGKTVFLRRIAWESAVEYGKLCLYVRPHARISYEALRELQQRSTDRLFLFVDDVALRSGELAAVIGRARQEGLLLTVIGTERQNQWNIGASDILGPLVNDDYYLRRLSDSEVEQLVDLLRDHNCAGRLSELSRDAQLAEFHDKAGRHLLIALHEATSGKPFEDILFDEYQQIQPDLARQIYLAVCVLNQHNVSVRAGIVSRIFGITFNDFNKRFFKPLEQVIFTRKDRELEDYVYTARHPIIAEMVVQRALPEAGRRLNFYLPIIRAMNISYKADDTALRALMRARNIIDEFPDYQMGNLLYEVAIEEFGPNAGIFHQRAIFEMTRPSASLARAGDYLNEADRLNPGNRAILHSFSELELHKAETANSSLEKEVHLGESRRLANRLIAGPGRAGHAFHTIAKIGLFKLEQLLSVQAAGLPWEIANVITEIEDAIWRGIQRYPDQAHLYEAESRLAELTLDSERAFQALKAGQMANPYDPVIAIRYAKALHQRGSGAEAVEVLDAALAGNATNKHLYFVRATVLTQVAPDKTEEIEWNFRHGFTEGDSNYEAQFWYARQAYLNGKISEAQSQFDRLRNALLSPMFKRDIRGMVQRDGVNVSFTGAVARKVPDYCFVQRDGPADLLFTHISHVDQAFWQRLSIGQRVRFKLGFTYRGAVAVQLEPE